MSIDINNPYVGLRPFYAEESLLLFGRDEQTLELLQRLHKHHFVAVVGSSGCGKSSLLRAGLIPSLIGGYLVDDSDQWLIAIMKPGQSPLYNLAESILKQIDPSIKSKKISDFVDKIKEEGVDAILELITPLREANLTNFFLLVDQFEELFRFTMEKKNASRKDESIDFVNIILELSAQDVIPFYVVFTMRSDFIGDCAQFHGLPEAMNKSQYLVPRLNRRQLKMVIEGPARLYGGHFSSALSSKLLNQLGQTQDELPLLQHILMRIWDYEEKTDKSGELDVDDYISVGGLENALSNHADEALNGMSDTEKGIAKEMFKALTAIDENGRKIRRPLLFSDLKKLTGATDQQLETIIDHFIRDKRSFLILENAGDSDDKVIDISHESLIRQWKTLREWVDEEAESASYYLQLSEATRLHKLKKKDFLTGSELQIALNWKEEAQPTAIWANRYKKGFQECIDYLNDSETEYFKDIIKERKRRRAKRISLASIAGLIAIFVVYFLYKGWQEKEYNIAFKNFIKGMEMRSTDPTKAIDLMMYGLSKYEFEDFRSIATYTYDNSELYEEIINGDENSNHPITFSSDGSGKFIVNNLNNSTLHSVDINTGKTIDSIVIKEPLQNALYCKQIKGYLISYENEGLVKLIDTKGQVIQEYKGHTTPITTINTNKDYSLFVTGSENGEIILWDLNGNQIYNDLDCHNGIVLNAIISPDNNRILSSSRDGTVKLTDVKAKSSNVVVEIEAYGIDFSSNGSKALVASLVNGDILVYNTASKVTDTIASVEEPVYYVDFSNDDKKILFGSSSGKVHLINLSESNNSTVIADSAVMPQFDRSGNTFTVLKDVNLDYSKFNIKRYNLKGEELHSLDDKVYNVTQLSINDDNNVLTKITNISSSNVRNKDGQLYRKLEGIPKNYYEQSPSLYFTPDGKNAYYFERTYNGLSLHVWDVETGNKLERVEQLQIEDADQIAISPKRGLDEIVVYGYYNDELAIWKKSDQGYIKSEIDFRILKKVKNSFYSQFENAGSISSLSLSPSGKILLCGHSSGAITMVNLINKEKKVIARHDRTINHLMFSPDESTFFSASFDKSVKMWPLNDEGEAISSISFIGNSAVITALQYYNERENIITGSNDGRLLLWNMNGEILKEYKGHNGLPIESITVSEDGKIMSGSSDGSVRAWSGLDTYETLLPFRDIYYDISSIHLKNDSVATIISAGAEKIKEFNLNTKALLKINWKTTSLDTIQFDFLRDSLTYELSRNFIVSPNGQRFVVNKKDNTFLMKNLLTNEIKEFDKNYGLWGSASFSNSSDKLAFGTSDGKLHLLNNSNYEIKSFKDKDKDNDQESTSQKTKIFTNIVFAPDESGVAYSLENDTILYYHNFNRDDRKRYYKGPSRVTAISFSDDGKMLASGTVDGKVIIWNSRDSIWTSDKKRLILEIESDHFAGQSINTLEFSADRTLLFAGTEYGKSLIWNIDEETDKNKGEYKATVFQFLPNQISQRRIIDAEFTSDNKQIVTATLVDVNIYNIKKRESFDDKFNAYLEKLKKRP